MAACALFPCAPCARPSEPVSDATFPAKTSSKPLGRSDDTPRSLTVRVRSWQPVWRVSRGGPVTAFGTALTATATAPATHGRKHGPAGRVTGAVTRAGQEAPHPGSPRFRGLPSHRVGGMRVRIVSYFLIC